MKSLFQVIRSRLNWTDATHLIFQCVGLLPYTVSKGKNQRYKFSFSWILVAWIVFLKIGSATIIVVRPWSEPAEKQFGNFVFEYTIMIYWILISFSEVILTTRSKDMFGLKNSLEHHKQAVTSSHRPNKSWLRWDWPYLMYFATMASLHIFLTYVDFLPVDVNQAVKWLIYFIRAAEITGFHLSILNFRACCAEWRNCLRLTPELVTEKGKLAPKPELVGRQLENFLHSVSNLQKKLIHIFGELITFSLASSSLCLTTTVYALVYRYRPSVPFTMLSYMAALHLVCSTGQSNSNQVDECIENITAAINGNKDERFRDSLRNCLAPLSSMRAMSIRGYYTLDNGCFLAILNSCWTYVLVLMQMAKETLSITLYDHSLI